MQLDRPAAAVEAFRLSLASGAAKERQDAAYGLAQAYLRLGLPVTADNTAALSPQSDERSRDLKLSILTARIRQAYDIGRYGEALIGLDSRAAIAPEPADLMSLRGWSYFQLQRYDEARRVFEALAAAGHEGALSALSVVQAAPNQSHGANAASGQF
jgi:tetratricopeptide (TPR) repeat protein